MHSPWNGCRTSPSTASTGSGTWMETEREVGRAQSLDEGVEACLLQDPVQTLEEGMPRVRRKGAHSRFPGHALTPTGVMAIRCKQFHLPDL